MKRMLLISLVVGLVAGQAFAGPYEMDRDTAALLRQTGTSSGDYAYLTYVGYNPGALGDVIFATGSPLYGATMQYAVGFKGGIDDATNDFIGSILIGLGNNFDSAGLAGVYDSYELGIANDNQQLWQYRLYAVVDGSYDNSGDWVTVVPGSRTTVAWDVDLDFDGKHVDDIGFEIQWNGNLNPRDDGTLQGGDDFHTSVVPLPGAVLLGMLGLSAAGIKLRKRG